MKTRLRCAIYTRKSSEEGLEQDFNSLDAQREACLAYILSQKGEGWMPVASRYDDGGWSGGNMERPGLKSLLNDIAAGRVDVVVVYKVDRLTRSLSDFARIVEIFDERQVSFVSVTQAFNTTSSMGRLTLNVLLSFAQFEREVTGERIRDKIAASKAKGMWVGGMPPLGYIPNGRTLKIDEKEAGLVRSIFTRYLALGSVHILAGQLREEGVVSKRWTTSKGVERGGRPFTRGALFYLLRNRIYLGEIVHRELVHPGQHDAILDRSLFDEVQAKLDAHVRRHKTATTTAAPLTGLIHDHAGNRMSPVHSRGRSGRVYHYYVSSPLQTGNKPGRHGACRIPAPAIEELLLTRLRTWSNEPLAGWDIFLPLVKRIEVRPNRVVITLDPSHLREWAKRIAEEDEIESARNEPLRIAIASSVKLRSGRRSIMTASTASRARPDRVLIANLRHAHRLLAEHGINHLSRTPQLDDARGIDDPWKRKLLRLAFLAPDIQHAILTGRQPAGLTLADLMEGDFPLDWDRQKEAFGCALLICPKTAEQVLIST